MWLCDFVTLRAFALELAHVRQSKQAWPCSHSIATLRRFHFEHAHVRQTHICDNVTLWLCDIKGFCPWTCSRSAEQASLTLLSLNRNFKEVPPCTCLRSAHTFVTMWLCDFVTLRGFHLEFAHARQRQASLSCSLLITTIRGFTIRKNCKSNFYLYIIL